MNKYSILKSNFLQDLSTDDYFRSFEASRALSPVVSISPFTINENHQWSRTSLLFSASEEMFKFPEVQKLSMPTHRDFNNLLSKLELITSTKSTLNKDSILSENDQLECIIEEGSYFYIKIPVKSKRSPLRVFVKKAHGKVMIYLSVFNQKPSMTNYEQAYSSDIFEFRSLEPIFRHEYVYLGIRALVHSKISVSVIFGKNRTQAIFEKRFRKKDTLPNDDIDLDQQQKILIKKKDLRKKNFIELNFHRRMLSPKELSQKHQEWNTKRELAISKKKNNLEEKKSRALAFVNRKQIRTAQQELEKEKIQYEIIRQRQTKFLLTIIYIQKVANRLNQIRYTKRQEISKKITMNVRARSLQRAYRRTTKLLTLTQIIGIRGLKLITFYHKSMRNLMKESVLKMLIKVIGNRAKRYLPISKFTDYFKKIIKIQNTFRRYLVVKGNRFRKLILFWDECKSFEVRRSIRKKSLIHQLNVSLYQRQMVLQKHYRECVEKCYNKIREAPKSIFISEVNSEKLMKRKRIIFEFMPTVQGIKKMMEEAHSISERGQKNDITNPVSNSK
ncbi:hypothetical protein SteCoe_27435 [Stentor coeruleus]|uniref:Uncharacterized protein n=1 Tax=Stentor coeruleus TaxID=5963 RepID=A0A1R2BAG4_9CILI|nr:hypothetical protein SteCoe_27435 [Stentor coeruleus]